MHEEDGNEGTSMGLGKDLCDAMESEASEEEDARIRQGRKPAALPPLQMSTGAVAERQASGRRKLLAFNLGSQSRDDVYRCFVIEL